MKEDNLIGYSIRLKPEQIAKITLLNIDFPNWVRKKFDEEFTNLEEIDRNINDLQRQIEDLNQRKALSIKKAEEKKIIPENEIKFLLETKEILSNKPEIIDGRISLYTNVFGKACRVSRAEFYELLERATKLNNDGEGGKKNG